VLSVQRKRSIVDISISLSAEERKDLLAALIDARESAADCSENCYEQEDRDLADQDLIAVTEMVELQVCRANHARQVVLLDKLVAMLESQA